MAGHVGEKNGGQIGMNNEQELESDDTTMSQSPCSEASSSANQKAKEVRTNNVSELVTKSKKAASSLWTLLHAKNCRMGVKMCSHAGCPEAKLMYLHLKTCSALLLEPCPSHHQGCQDARKLLAHYRRCRDIRARQAQNPATRSQQHVCLVCSLVARHAKFALDRTTSGFRSSSPKTGGSSSHYIPSLILTDESFESNRSAAVTLSHAFDENRGVLSSRPPTISSQRFAFSRPSIECSNSRGFQALQAAVSCAISCNPPSTSSLDAIGEDFMGTHGIDTSKLHRPRSESLDVRSSQLSPQVISQDGTKNMNYLYLAAVESLEEEPAPQSRRRSQSCSVPSVSSSLAVDPIRQKPLGEELQYIFEGDS